LIAVRNCKVAVAGYSACEQVYLFYWTVHCEDEHIQGCCISLSSLSLRSVQLYQILTLYCYSSDAISSMYLTAFHFCGTGVCSVNRTMLCLCVGCYESVDSSTGMEYWNGLNCYKMLSTK